MKTDETALYSAVDRFLNDFLAETPVGATQLGDHRFDHRLGDHTADALRRQEAQFRQALMELGDMDTSSFGPDAVIDHAIVVRLVRSFLREIDPLRMHETSPGSYIDECLGGVFLVLARDFAPFPVRMKASLGRLREVPRVLAEAKQNLIPERVPPVWVEMALDSATQGRQLFTLLVPFLALRTPWLFPQVAMAARRAAAAVDDYAAFLKTAVAPNARGDFAVGKSLFEEMLHDQHLLDLSADELLATGHRLFDETLRSMDELARKIDPARTAREILDEAKNRHPSADKLLDTYRHEVARARSFVVDHAIATIPEGESLRVEPTRSEERRVGKECDVMCRSRWSPYH
jgi:uncharacterized protein (DUF885 family)